MRVALVHDYIKEYGGAERVLEALHEIWPDAPVYTSVYLPSFLGPHRERFKDWNIKTSIAQYVPLKQKLISPLRVVAPILFSQFDFSLYDVVIVSATGAYEPNTIRKGKAIHMCYCHTPPRYLYGYATAREWKNNVLLRIFGELANHFLRMVDFTAAQNVDYFIANSHEVRKRIAKFYRKDAVVIYPPVDINSKYEILNTKQTQNSQYFLAGGRLARPKHIDLIIATCMKYGYPLKVFGKGFAGYEQELKMQMSNVKSTTQKSKVEFVGEVTDEEKFELMAGAKAFLFASEDEDFGITPVEAMSVGTAVIAYRSGGVKESIREGKTGLFFDELTVEGLHKAIEQWSNVTMKQSDCIKQAKKFSKERFQKEIKEFVEECLKKRR